MAGEIDDVAAEYLDAANGSAEAALVLAIADLFTLSAEAQRRLEALDQWTSRGYVRGRASALLEGQRERMRDAAQRNGG